MIPVEMLLEGRVDETISAVIHELHHIKFSDKEDAAVGNIFPYAEKFFSSIEVDFYGTKMSILQALNTEGSYTPTEIYTRTLTHPYAPFIYQVFGDLFFLMNAIEDVRIDELQPANLKKYRFKQEKIAFSKFQDSFKTGDIDQDTLFGKAIMALFAFKGFGKSSYSEDSRLTKDIITKCNVPSLLIPLTFKVFGESIQKHIGGLWQQNKDAEEQVNSAISSYLADEKAGENSEKGDETQDVEDLEISKIKSSKCPALDENFSNSIREIWGEEKISDMLTAMGNQEGSEPSLPVKTVLCDSQWAEIQSFSKLKHISCREDFECATDMEYDTLIYDCYA